VGALSPPLHVGLDLLFWHPRAGGIARYARELIPAMRALEPDLRVTAYVSSELPEEAPALLGPGIRLVRYRARPTHGSVAGGVRNLWAHWARIPWHAQHAGVDVVHGLANVAPLWAGSVARVATLHDLIWLRDRGDSMGGRATIAMRATALPSAWLADRVITPSLGVKEDVCASLRIGSDRLDVVAHGIAPGPPPAPGSEAMLRERFQLGEAPVILCVAQKRAHKNLEALVRALPRLADRRAVLVLPGEPTPYEQALRTCAAQLGVAHRVRFPDWCSDAEIEGLYALADVFCLPSFDEGFGLPILEAMRRGTPVACSDRPALRETAGDAADLFDPDDAAAVAAALQRLLESPERRRRLTARGLARCALFSWERSARLTLASYRRAIVDRRTPTSWSRRARRSSPAGSGRARA
jgi:glycosyltransferase involved in cell wall biosynthesis